MNHRPDVPSRRQPLTSIEHVLEALRTADAAGRSKLPDPPRGFEWHSEIVIGQGSDPTEVTARVAYHVRPIVTELRARSPH